MIKQHIDDITYLCFGNLQKHSNLLHFVSTREGGCSTGKFGTLNLSIKLEPDSNCVIENRKRLLQAVGLPIETLTLGTQTHSSNVTIVDKTMMGSGSESFLSALPNTDALLTPYPGITIAVLVADCAPILLFDPVRKVIGVVHAGRMGTISEISRKTIEKMVIEFSTNPADIVVGVGPSICARHYPLSVEAQQQIRETLCRDYLVHTPDGSVCFDLWKANAAQLITAGVQPNNVEIAELCTYENSMFFSERRDGKPTGRFCAGICMSV